MTTVLIASLLCCRERDDRPSGGPARPTRLQASRGSQMRSRACAYPPLLRGAQEGEHGEHAAVVVAAGGQLERVEDARRVLLHGALADGQALGDALVRAA